MLKKFLTRNLNREKGNFLTLIIFILVSVSTGITFYLSSSLNKGSTVDYREASASGNFEPDPMVPIRNAIIYQPPTWPSDGSYLTPKEIVERFSVIIYARGQMLDHMESYLNAGFKGDALIYFLADTAKGPPGLSSKEAQGKTCAENGITNPNVDVGRNNVTMDPGDFCEIHDTIVYNNRNPNNKRGLPDYPDIIPTEDWFVHKPLPTPLPNDTKGDRYEFQERGGSEYSNYFVNPGNSGWQEFFARRVLRELVPNFQPNYRTAPGITGVYLDNVDLDRRRFMYTNYAPQDQRVYPVEYADDNSYKEATKGFVEHIHNRLYSQGRNFDVWAGLHGSNQNDSNRGGSEWNEYDPYLEGAMDEPFSLAWTRSIYSQSVQTREREMEQAAWWVEHGNHFVADVAGGFPDGAYNTFTFAQYLMITDGRNASYKYGVYNQTLGPDYGPYMQYPDTSYPDYSLPLGQPLGPRIKISESPVVYERSFKCGKVRLDLTNHTSKIDVTPCSGSTTITPTFTPTPTRRVTPTFTPTPTPSLSCTLTSNPSTGRAPLTTTLTGNVSGTATGPITYRFDCTSNNTYERIATVSSTTYTWTNGCTYSTPGSYTQRLDITRQSLNRSCNTTVRVSPSPTPTFTPTPTPTPSLSCSLTSRLLGTVPPRGVLTAAVSGTATGLITYEFDCTSNGTYEFRTTTSSTSYTFSGCVYTSPGSYTPSVRVTRQGLVRTCRGQTLLVKPY